MAKLNIAFVATVLILVFLNTASTQADQTTLPDQATAQAPTPAQLSNQSCFDLLVVQNKKDDCANDVLKYIGPNSHESCGGYCHVSRDCCYKVVALDTNYPGCWKYLMKNNGSEENRYMLVMTCAKSLPSD